MTPESKIEIAVRRARETMFQQFPQNEDVLRALGYLADEIMLINLEPKDGKSEGLPRDPRFAGSQIANEVASTAGRDAGKNPGILSHYEVVERIIAGHDWINFGNPIVVEDLKRKIATALQSAFDKGFRAAGGTVG